MKNKVDIDSFIQICIVVKDIEKAVDGFCAIFGVPRPEIGWHESHGGDENLLYRGKPAEPYRVKVCNINTGRGFVIELHEPVSGKSTFSEFYEKHGAGVHHIGFEVGNARDAVCAELEAQDFALRTIGYYPGSSWTIVDTEDTLGVNLNIKPVR